MRFLCQPHQKPPVRRNKSDIDFPQFLRLKLKVRQIAIYNAGEKLKLKVRQIAIYNAGGKLKLKVRQLAIYNAGGKFKLKVRQIAIYNAGGKLSNGRIECRSWCKLNLTFCS